MSAPAPQAVQVLCEIADGARVAPDARVGAFCVVGPCAAIGPGTVLGSRVSVLGNTTIGRDNVIGDGSVLGAAPQDLKFHGQCTYLVIGDRNRLGSNVTAHVGTELGGYVTRIGNDNVLETGAHVAHDCFVDDHTHFSAGVLLAGHIRVQTGAVLEDMLGVTHFTTIGPYARCGARTPVQRDVPPFAYFSSGGYYTCPPRIMGVHEQGMAAAGLDQAQRQAVRDAIAHFFGEETKTLAVKVRQMLAQPSLTPPLQMLAEFCLRTLQAKFGRYRESLRGKIPPEALPYLPQDLQDQAQAIQ